MTQTKTFLNCSKSSLLNFRLPCCFFFKYSYFQFIDQQLGLAAVLIIQFHNVEKKLDVTVISILKIKNLQELSIIFIRLI